MWPLSSRELDNLMHPGVHNTTKIGATVKVGIKKTYIACEQDCTNIVHDINVVTITEVPRNVSISTSCTLYMMKIKTCSPSRLVAYVLI